MALLSIDRPSFPANYGRRPFTFNHSLQGHPLLSLGALFDLARRLPAAQVLHWNGRIPFSADIDAAAELYKADLSLTQAIAHLDTAGSFVLIREAETDPAYRALLHSILAEVAELTEPLDPGMRERIAYLFIASPGCVTPYHMDREINFLLQIQGRKDYWVWSPDDRDLLPEPGREQLFARQKLRRPEYRLEYQEKAHHNDLRAGTGVHQPFLAPHMAKNGDAVSVAMAATYRTQRTHRRAALYRLNHSLRQLGVAPTPVGQSAIRDSLKYGVVEAYRRARKLFRKAG